MKKQKFAATPRITKAVITGKELLLAIRKAVLDEPKRADLSWWVLALNGHKNPEDPPEALPACGTVACLAGWGAVLLRPSGVDAMRLSDHANRVMQELLGYDHVIAGSDAPNRSTGWLFNSQPQSRANESPETFGAPGTRKHARTIARRIARYLQKHPEVATREIDVKAARKALAR